MDDLLRIMADSIVNEYRSYSPGGELRNILSRDFFQDEIFGNEFLIGRVFENPDTGTSKVLLNHIVNIPGRLGGLCFDFGAGYGATSRCLTMNLPNITVISIDHNYRLLSRSFEILTTKENLSSNTTFIVADILALPLNQGIADLGVSVGTVRYLLDCPEDYRDSAILPRSHIALDSMLEVMKNSSPLVLVEIGDAGRLAFDGDSHSKGSSDMVGLLGTRGYTQVDEISELVCKSFHRATYQATLLRNTRLYFLIAYLQDHLLENMIDHIGLQSILVNPQETHRNFVSIIERHLGRAIHLDRIAEDVEFLDLLISLAGTDDKKVHVLTVMKGT